MGTLSNKLLNSDQYPVITRLPRLSHEEGVEYLLNVESDQDDKLYRIAYDDDKIGDGDFHDDHSNKYSKFLVNISENGDEYVVTLEKGSEDKNKPFNQVEEKARPELTNKEQNLQSNDDSHTNLKKIKNLKRGFSETRRKGPRKKFIPKYTKIKKLKSHSIQNDAVNNSKPDIPKASTDYKGKVSTERQSKPKHAAEVPRENIPRIITEVKQMVNMEADTAQLPSEKKNKVFKT